jgi:hypothetical protein
LRTSEPGSRSSIPVLHHLPKGSSLQRATGPYTACRCTHGATADRSVESLLKFTDRALSLPLSTRVFVLLPGKWVQISMREIDPSHVDAQYTAISYVGPKRMPHVIECNGYRLSAAHILPLLASSTPQYTWISRLLPRSRQHQPVWIWQSAATDWLIRLASRMNHEQPSILQQA